MGGPGALGGPGGAWRGLESAVGSSQAARAVLLSLWHRPASGTQVLEEEGQAAQAWVPEPWPCTAGPGTLQRESVTKSIVCGNSLPGFGPGSSFTSQVSLGQGHNSPKRREPAK